MENKNIKEEQARKEILQRLDKFNNVSITNPCFNANYCREDEEELFKELEQKYHCKIDRTFYTIKFLKEV